MLNPPWLCARAGTSPASVPAAPGAFSRSLEGPHPGAQGPFPPHPPPPPAEGLPSSPGTHSAPITAVGSSSPGGRALTPPSKRRHPLQLPRVWGIPSRAPPPPRGAPPARRLLPHCERAARVLGPPSRRILLGLCGWGLTDASVRAGLPGRPFPGAQAASLAPGLERPQGLRGAAGRLAPVP